MPIGYDVGDLSASDAPVGIDPGAFGEVVRAGQPLTAIVWTRWRTAEDERVCPECGPLDGLSWPTDDGPAPPLHRNCRCTREFDRIDVGTRRED